MPDFRGDKRRQPARRQPVSSLLPQKRETLQAERRLAAVKEAPLAKDKKEHPNEAFRRLLRDFQLGIASLHRSEPALTIFRDHTLMQQARPALVQTTILRSEQIHPILVQGPATVERLGGSQMHTITREIVEHMPHMPGAKEVVERVIHTSGAKEVAERTIRMPGTKPISRPRLQSRNTPMGDLRRYPGMTGADREAVRQVSARHYDGSPEHLPSAARLAQILRADSLLKASEGTQHPAIKAWAHAIKSGQRRAIADLDPRMVQSVLHSALGGSTKAERLLHTPMIERLIERHRSNMTTIHEQLRQVEHGRTPATHSARLRAKQDKLREKTSLEAPRLDGAVGVPGLAVAPILNRLEKSAPVHPVNNRSASSYAALSFRDRHRDSATELEFEPQLRDMMATNEEAHLPLAQAAEQREAREIDKPSVPALKTDRHTARDTRFSSQRSVGAPIENNRANAATLNVPSPKPSINTGNTSQTAHSKQRLRLEGEIKISNQGGQQIGMGHAELEAK